MLVSSSSSSACMSICLPVVNCHPCMSLMRLVALLCGTVFMYFSSIFQSISAIVSFVQWFFSSNYMHSGRPVIWWRMRFPSVSVTTALLRTIATALLVKIGIGGVGVVDSRIRSASLSIAMLITACGVRSSGETLSSWCAGTCSVVMLIPKRVDAAHFCPNIEICCHGICKVVESSESV